MPLWTAAAAPRPGSGPRCTCAFNYSASEPLHVGLDACQHLLHVKLQRSPAGGYLRLARQHLNAAPFPCRTAPGFICKQLIPVTEVVCLLHRGIGGAGEFGGGHWLGKWNWTPQMRLRREACSVCGRGSTAFCRHQLCQPHVRWRHYSQ